MKKGYLSAVYVYYVRWVSDVIILYYVASVKYNDTTIVGRHDYRVMIIIIIRILIMCDYIYQSNVRECHLNRF